MPVGASGGATVRGISWCLGLAWSALLSGHAVAADCKPLQYLTGIPITLGEKGVEVGALLNKSPQTLVLSLGSLGYLTHKTVSDLGLVEREAGVQVYTSSGEVAKTAVRVSKVALGPIQIADMSFMVFGNPPDIRNSFPLQIFRKYDLDVDYGSGRLNFFSPDHCEGRVTYWPAAAVAVVPYRGEELDDLKISVAIDGKEAEALVNISGVPESTMGLAEATRLFGLTADSPGMQPELLNGETVYRHVFPTLSFGGVTVSNAVFLIVPEKINTMFKEKSTGSLLSESKFKDYRKPTIIGTNVMRKLHLYIATKERKIYVAPSDAAAAKALPPAAVAIEN